MHIVNKAKDLLKKFQSGNLSLSDFKELVSTVNDSSDQELEDVFSKNGINLIHILLYLKKRLTPCTVTYIKR